jgi:hypothetical protein
VDVVESGGDLVGPFEGLFEGCAAGIIARI